MGFLLGIGIPLLISGIGLILLVCTILHFYNKAKRTMNDLFGTDDLGQLIETRNEEMANTPKSVSGMTAVYSPLIQSFCPVKRALPASGFIKPKSRTIQKNPVPALLFSSPASSI